MLFTQKCTLKKGRKIGNNIQRGLEYPTCFNLEWSKAVCLVNSSVLEWLELFLTPS